MVSTVRWSCIGRDVQNALVVPLFSVNRLFAVYVYDPLFVLRTEHMLSQRQK
jgi:hypothetical protein